MKHKHHIVPKHAGGSDHPSNIIELTIEEHAEAHKILYEQHGRIQDKMAWVGLSQKRKLTDEETRQLFLSAQKEFLADPIRKTKWQETLRSLAIKQHLETTAEDRLIISNKISSTLKEKYLNGTMKYHPPKNPDILRENYYKHHNKTPLAKHSHKSEKWKKTVKSEKHKNKMRLISKNKKQVSINGNVYHSIRHAAKSIGLSYTKLRTLLLSDNNNYIFLC